MSKTDPKSTVVNILPKNDSNIQRSQDERTRAAMQAAQQRIDQRDLRGQQSQGSLTDVAFLNMEVKKNETTVSSDIEEVESEMMTGSKLGRKGAETVLTGIYEEEEQQQKEEEARKAKEHEKQKRFKGFTKKLFKRDKTKQKVGTQETDYRSSQSQSGSSGTTSSAGGSYDEGAKFKLPPELTEEIEGERLDMHDVKRISDLKDKNRPPPQKPQERPDMMRKQVEEKKTGGKDITDAVENVGSEIITRTIDESESKNSRSSYTGNSEKIDSSSSISGSVFQNSEVFIKAHTGSKIENQEESKESIN